MKKNSKVVKYILCVIASIMLLLSIGILIVATYLAYTKVAAALYIKEWDGVPTFCFLAALYALFTWLGLYYQFWIKNNKVAFCSYTFNVFMSFMLAMSFNHELSGTHMQKVEIRDSYIVFDAGVVGFTTAMQLDYLLLTSGEHFTRAAMSGPGGNTNAALYMKYRLLSHGVTETIAYGSKCASSCTIIWSAGESRHIRDNLYLAFHSTCSLGSNCDAKPYLYDGFLTRDQMSVIAAPDAEHACPIGSNEIEVLEGAESPEKDELWLKITNFCDDKGGETLEKFSDFTGYENITI
ncbi:hypothetical protein QPB21_001817 [Vibrio alginolyticus]|nr:hypothetical protein [Vibrio parahaemolyticus]ELB1639368.1 hypothetical protein [Vibrio alginolyticus]MCS0415173.1 hypothetical protein [Vibrio diabolicus]EGQ8029187.1 hypothetical protein [Vibrio parahaemolyticus]EHH2490469.1 hypothetical protein [Vibrio parahaemolyticus]EHK0046605.1 hypothetical protein [Vibrio parahaemolyticus]